MDEADVHVTPNRGYKRKKTSWKDSVDQLFKKAKGIQRKFIKPGKIQVSLRVRSKDESFFLECKSVILLHRNLTNYVY